MNRPQSETEDPIADPEVSMLDLALVFAENLQLLFAVPFVAGLLALLITFVWPPMYTATAHILPPAQQQNASAAMAAQLGALAGIVGGAIGIKNPTDQYAALLKTRTVYDAIISRFKLRELYGERYIEDTRKELERRVNITASAKDGIIGIEVDDRDPKRAAEMANAFVDELGKLTKTLAITEAAQRRVFFEAQLKQTKDSLTQSEIDLRGSGVSEATIKAVPQSAVEALARLKAQITAQEIKISAIRTFMTESNPEFRLALQELLALRAELSKAEQNNPAKGAGQGTEYIAKFREFKYHETLFELMAKQYELARLDEAREGSVIQVVDAAEPPEKRSRPKKAVITLLTAMGALILTVLFVFVREGLRNSLRDEEKLQRLKQSLRSQHIWRTS